MSLKEGSALTPAPANQADQKLGPGSLVDSHVGPMVLGEIEQLSDEYDIRLTDVPDVYRPDAARQAMIDQRVAELEASPTGADEFRSLPALSKWAPLTKRAIALATLYSPNSYLIGTGVTPDAYDKPIFDGRSANQVLREQLGPKAEKWINAYADFVSAVVDEGDENHLGTRDFMKGVKDSEAVRTRATAAMEMTREYIESRPSLRLRQDLVSASLACGAAGPVYQLARELGQQGHNFSEVILVDQDPMALASADALAGQNGMEGKVNLQLRDLLTENLTDYIEPHSVDVVDLLGLFEYLPNTEQAPVASYLLKKVKEIVRPGGLIIFGNMLNERPQQTFFSDVVQWPQLEQRSISEVLGIVEQAGYKPEDVSVRVPAYEGVYSVYGIRIPEITNGAVDKRPVAAQLGLTAIERY